MARGILAVSVWMVFLAACSSSDAIKTAPTISAFAAIPSSVPADSPTAVRWIWGFAEIPNPMPDCSIDHGVGAVLNGATSTITIAVNTVYTLTCVNSAGTDTAGFTIATVAAPVAPELDQFTATPSSVVTGTDAFVKWEWTYTNQPTPLPSCEIDNNVGPVLNGVATSVNLATDTVFTLTCVNGGGTSSKQVTVTTVTAPVAPVIASFGTDTSSVLRNADASVQWNWSFANSPTPTPTCSISNGVGTDLSSGTFTTVNIAADTTYTLTCSNAGGTATAITTLTVTDAPVAPVFDTFTVSPASVTVGVPTNITWTWSFSNQPTPTPSCSIGGVGTLVSGTTTSVTLSADTTYTLTCTNAGGSASVDAEITTVAAPVPPVISTFSASPGTVTMGVDTSVTWHWAYSNSPTPTPSCSIDHNVNGVSIDDQTTINLVSDTTYTLTCTNGGGTSSAFVVVKTTPVPVAPEIVGFAGTPSVVTVGTPTNVVWTWSYNNTPTPAPSCTVTPDGGSPFTVVSGQATSVNLTAPSTTFTLRCTNDGGTATTTTAITTTAVPVAPVMASFTANPASVIIDSPTKVTFDWSYANTPTPDPTCTIDNLVGTVQSGASKDLTLGSDTVFTITCTNTKGSASAFVTVFTAPAPVAPVLGTVTATPSIVVKGVDTNVVWTWDFATAPTPQPTCTVAQSGEPATTIISGQATSVSLTEDTHFTIACSNDGGADQRDVLITATDVPIAPVIASFSTDPSSVVQDTDNLVEWNWTFANTPTPSPVCTVVGVGSFDSGTETNVNLSDSATFVLSCVNTAGTATATTSIAAVPEPIKPVLSTFKTDPGTVLANSASTVTWQWTFANLPVPAPNCSIDQNVGNVSNGDSSALNISADTLYTLTCTNSAGTTTLPTLVNAAPLPVAPALQSFTATPGAIEADVPTNVKWTWTYFSWGEPVPAATCTIDHDVGVVSNGATVSISISQPTWFTITCDNGYGSQTSGFFLSTVQGPVGPRLSQFWTTPNSLLVNTPTQVRWFWNFSNQPTPWPVCEVHPDDPSNPDVGTIAFGDSANITISSDAFYTITCTNDGGSDSRTVRFSAQMPVAPRIGNFFADPNVVAANITTTINWNWFFQNNPIPTPECTLDGIPVPSNGYSSDITISDQTTYTLRCWNEAGEDTRTTDIMVSVPVAPVIENFTVDQNPVWSGHDTTVHWYWNWAHGQNPIPAATCTIQGIPGTLQSGSASTINISASTNYTLTCSNGVGNPSSATVTIDVTSGVAPEIDSFTISPDAVMQGTTTELTFNWSFSPEPVPAPNCTIAGVGNNLTSGWKKNVTLNADQIYTLSCTNESGTDSESFTVTALSPSDIFISGNIHQQGGGQNGERIFVRLYTSQTEVQNYVKQQVLFVPSNQPMTGASYLFKVDSGTTYWVRAFRDNAGPRWSDPDGQPQIGPDPQASALEVEVQDTSLSGQDLTLQDTWNASRYENLEVFTSNESFQASGPYYQVGPNNWQQGPGFCHGFYLAINVRMSQNSNPGDLPAQPTVLMPDGSTVTPLDDGGCSEQVHDNTASSYDSQLGDRNYSLGFKDPPLGKTPNPPNYAGDYTLYFRNTVLDLIHVEVDNLPELFKLDRSAMLTSPTGAAHANSTQPALSWNAVANANGYDLGISWSAGNNNESQWLRTDTNAFTPQSFSLSDQSRVVVRIDPLRASASGNGVDARAYGVGNYFVVDVDGTHVIQYSGQVTKRVNQPGNLLIYGRGSQYNNYPDWDASIVVTAGATGTFDYSLEVLPSSACSVDPATANGELEVVIDVDNAYDPETDNNGNWRQGAGSIDSCVDVILPAIVFSSPIEVLNPLANATNVSTTPNFQWTDYHVTDPSTDTTNLSYLMFVQPNNGGGGKAGDPPPIIWGLPPAATNFDMANPPTDAVDLEYEITFFMSGGMQGVPSLSALSSGNWRWGIFLIDCQYGSAGQARTDYVNCVLQMVGGDNLQTIANSGEIPFTVQ